jgi:hypothetical protein
LEEALIHRNRRLYTLGRRCLVFVLIHLRWFILCGLALVAISLTLPLLNVAELLSVLIGVVGFLLAGIAVAALALAHERYRWFLGSAILIWITGVLFVLPHNARPPNSLLVAAILLLASGGFALWRAQHD